MNENKLIKPKQACDLLGITIKTLQNWDHQGKIKIVRSPSNRRLIPMSEVYRLLDQIENDGLTILYARVSSYDQKHKGDLDRQVASLAEAASDFRKIKVITDVGSGLNDKRKGLLKVMEMAKRREIDCIMVTYKDRLTRFGFNYLETFFTAFDVEIIVLNDTFVDKSPQEEMIEDLMSIISSFAGKLYGLRSRKHTQVTKKTKEILLDGLNLSNQDKR